MSLLEDISKLDFYTGSKKDFNTFSVTEIADNEPFIGYLMRTSEKKEKEVTQATVGQIFDIGMREIVKSTLTQYKSGERISMDFGSFTLTGEPDIIDEHAKVIYDIKLTKKYTLQKVLEEKERHNYVRQLNLYDYMLGGGYDLVLFVALKDQTELKADYNAIEEVDIPRMDKYFLTSQIELYVSKVQMMLNGEIEIPYKCSNQWANDMRCKFFCDYVESCPYGKKYKPKSIWQ